MTDPLTSPAADHASGHVPHTIRGPLDYAPNLIADLSALRRETPPGHVPEAESPARRRIVEAVVRWLLRTATASGFNHESGLGPQLLVLLTAARLGGPGGAAPDALLTTFADALGLLREDLVRPFTSGRTYDVLVPGELPREALKESGQRFARFLTELPSGPPDTGRNLEFADTFHARVSVENLGTMHTVPYPCMPRRAAVLGALLRPWVASLPSEDGEDAAPDEPAPTARHADVFAAVLDHLDGQTSALGDHQLVESRLLLGVLLAEAIDDHLYRALFAAPDAAAPIAAAHPAGECPPPPDAGPAHDERLAARGRAALWILRDRVQRPLLDRMLPSRAGGTPARENADADRYPTQAAGGTSAARQAITAVDPRRVSTGGRRHTVAPRREPPFDALIVPSDPFELHDPRRPTAEYRVDLAALAFMDGLAPWIVVSGGSAFPTGQKDSPLGDPAPHESRMFGLLRKYDATGFVRRITGQDVLVVPAARHAATHLRNTGRLLLRGGLLGPYLVLTGGRGPVEASNVEGSIKLGAGIMAGTIATGMAVGAAGVALVQSDQDKAMMATIGTGVAVGGVAAGAAVIAAGHKGRDLKTGAASPTGPVVHATEYRDPARQEFVRRCREGYGEPPFLFLGTPREFLGWCDGGDAHGGVPIAEAQAGEDCRIVEHVKRRARAHRDAYRGLPSDDHIVFVPRFRVTYHFSLRDLLDA